MDGDHLSGLEWREIARLNRRRKDHGPPRRYLCRRLFSMALFGWIPFVLVLFALMPPHRAAAVAVVGAWLVLPPAGIAIAGLPDISKYNVTTAGIMMGTLFFGSHYVMRFRPRWFDLPMLVWCFIGLATSLQNGLGLYDGLTDILGQALMWGLPYLCGRLYFSDPDGLRTFAVTMIGGGLSYILPCLWESANEPKSSP